MNRIGSALGYGLAPLVYMLGRAVRSPQLVSKSVLLDVLFLRGYLQALQFRGKSSDGFHTLSQAARLCAMTGEGSDRIIQDLIGKSHSQLLQDIVCLLAHSCKKGGYFVEVGVGDGTTYSNTLLLERDFGWKGLLAEPSVRFHDTIRRTRSAVLDTRAVFGTTGKVLDFEEDDNFGELSGLASGRVSRGPTRISRYQVSTISLDDLLDEHGAPGEIDFMSIDTEGSELEILRSLDHRKHRVGMFALEHNNDGARKGAFSELLAPRGYREILPEVSMFDAWYLHADVKSRFL